jgi:enterochelin esterase-like enzyme
MAPGQPPPESAPPPGAELVRNTAFALLAAIAAAFAAAQVPPPPRRNTYRAPNPAAAAPRFVSPEVHADRTITFRLRAPAASAVHLAFAGADRPMAKDAAGVWSITIGPVEPEIHTYSFSLDGVRVLDMANPVLKNGRAPDASVVEVPGTPPRFDQVQDVPHGAIHIRAYTSAPLQSPRRLYVYVPPQYDSEPASRFPVLYLRHGNGDDEANWTEDGRAGVILDNLLARRAAVPMLIVMTNGYTDGNWGGGSTPEGIEVAGKELLGDVIPFIESRYRVIPGAANRAITGLSMGGGQAFTIGLKHQDTFAWVGEFSSGLVSDADFQLEKHLPGFLDDAAAVNRRLRLLFLSCGTEDPRYAGQLDLVDTLKGHNIRCQWFSTPGAHEWKVWRHALAEFLQKVFQRLPDQRGVKALAPA